MTRSLSALFVVLAAVPAFAADTPKDFAARCDAYMQARARYSATKFSGSVLVAKDGQIVYEKGFGYANREYDVPNTPGTRPKRRTCRLPGDRDKCSLF